MPAFYFSKGQEIPSLMGAQVVKGVDFILLISKGTAGLPLPQIDLSLMRGGTHPTGILAWLRREGTTRGPLAPPSLSVHLSLLA